MEQLQMMIREHRTAFLVALALLIVFVGLSATRCVDLQQQREIAAQEQKDTAYEKAASGGEKKADIDQADAAAKLTDSQKQAQVEYDDATRAFISLLASNTWTAKQETNTLQFTDTTYTESTQNGTETHPYVITAMTTGNDGTRQVETTNAAIETDTGTYILEFYKAASEGSSEAIMGVSCSAFKNQGYTRAASASGLTVAGLNSSFNSLIGGQSDELEQAMKDYCSQHYPTATTATWEQIASVDYEKSTVVTAFTLDNAAKTQINVTYHTEANTFDID